MNEQKSVEEQFVDELEAKLGSDVIESVDEYADLSQKDRAIAKLAALDDEQQEQVAALINKYREKLLKDKLAEMKRMTKPKSFYTKKGPGRGKKRRV